MALGTPGQSTLVAERDGSVIATLGREPHTPLDEAIEATLVGLGSSNTYVGQPGNTFAKLVTYGLKPTSTTPT